MLDKIFWLILIGMLAVYLSYFAAMFLLSRRKLKFKKEEIFPEVSLIIPTFNEARVILRKLNNICELKYPKEKLETILVDSASKDETVSLAEKFLSERGKEFNMRLVSLKERLGKASALNHVWQMCNGEIVIISDADCLLESNSVSEVVKAFADSSVGVVTGSHVIVNPGKFAAKSVENNYRSIFSVLRQGESYLDSTPIVNGQLCAYRKKLIENLNEDSVCDDIELAMRIRRKGYRIVFEPRAVFFEFTPRKFLARLKQKSRRAQGIIQQLFRFSNMMFKKRYGSFAFLIFPFEFFFHIVSPVILAFLLFLLILNIFNPVFLTTISVLLLFFLALSGALLLIGRLKKNKLGSAMVPFTFLESQLYLFLGLLPLLIGRTSHKWKIIDEVRELNSETSLDS